MKERATDFGTSQAHAWREQEYTGQDGHRDTWQCAVMHTQRDVVVRAIRGNACGDTRDA